MKRHPREVAAILAAVGLLATACGQSSEAPSNKARANAPLKLPQATLEGGGTNATADDALKERLARQEAATKLFDKTKAEPAPKPEPARATPEPAKPAPASEPVRLAASAPVSVGTAPQKLPEPEPVKVAEPPKAEVVAAAKPATVPAPVAPAIAAAKLVTRVDPDFPREAIQAGAEVGHVRARMTLDGNGNVTRVEVVEASPRRVFDRSVVRALSQWRFNEGPSGRTVETEVDFKLK